MVNFYMMSKTDNSCFFCAVLRREQGINGCFAHLCVCRWEFPSPFSHIRVAARFIETLPLSPFGPSEKQKDGAGHQEVF